MTTPKQDKKAPNKTSANIPQEMRIAFFMFAFAFALKIPGYLQLIGTESEESHSLLGFLGVSDAFYLIGLMAFVLGYADLTHKSNQTMDPSQENMQLVNDNTSTDDDMLELTQPEQTAIIVESYEDASDPHSQPPSLFNILPLTHMDDENHVDTALPRTP